MYLYLYASFEKYKIIDYNILTVVLLIHFIKPVYCTNKVLNIFFTFLAFWLDLSANKHRMLLMHNASL